MLVLSRRVGEEIAIANDIRVTVVAIQGQRVRLGISAPPSLSVVRMELSAMQGDAASRSVRDEHEERTIVCQEPGGRRVART